MARDIEEFLRRAAERRKQQLKEKQQPATPRRPQPVSPPPQREPDAPARRLVISDDVEIVRQPLSQEIDMRSESVSGHVQRHINTSEIAEHVSHLADQIEQTDERLESRLHEKFDHKLGNLGAKPSVQDDVVPTVKGEQVSHIANDLIRMLSSPASVRQAILIAEVLKRPDFDVD